VLTKEQVKRYLEVPDECPKCRSNGYTSSGQVDVQGNNAMHDVVCADCGFTGVDIYTLTCIEEDEE